MQRNQTTEAVDHLLGQISYLRQQVIYERRWSRITAIAAVMGWAIVAEMLVQSR